MIDLPKPSDSYRGAREQQRARAVIALGAQGRGPIGFRGLGFRVVYSGCVPGSSRPRLPLTSRPLSLCVPVPVHAASTKPHHQVLSNGVVLGYSHLGMLASARWIYKQATSQLKSELAQHPGYGVRIVGELAQHPGW